MVDSMPTFYKIESIELNLTDPLNCLFKTITSQKLFAFQKALFCSNIKIGLLNPIAEKPSSVDST